MFEKGEGISSIVSEISDYFVIIKMLNFVGVVFYYGIIKWNLVVVINYDFVVVVYIYNSGYDYFLLLSGKVVCKKWLMRCLYGWMN